MSKEMWKDITDYEGIYQVSNKGRVRSLDRYTTACYGSKRWVKGVILSPNIKQGYPTVGLHKRSKRKWFPIHRLVAIEFIPNTNSYPIINHINEIKDDNRVENLEWCTYQHNNTWGNRLVGWGHKTRDGLRKEVYQMDIDGNIIKKWDAMIDASKELNISVGGISNVCNGRDKTSGGFTWKLVNEVVDNE